MHFAVSASSAALNPLILVISVFWLCSQLMGRAGRSTVRRCGASVQTRAEE